MVPTRLFLPTLMPLDLQKIINSTFGIHLAQFIGRSLPVRAGYPFADFIGEQIARRRHSRIVRAVRANQWVAHGGRLEGEALEQLVHQTFRHSARSVFDLYHFIDDPQAAGRLFVLNQVAGQLIRRPKFSGRGLVIAGLHLSSFDLSLQWLVRSGMKPMVLTIPDPQGGRRMEYELRKKTGMNLVPGSMVALRQALRHLQQGGLVLTGIDRPVPEPELRPRFFGRPAALPSHHVFLAGKARVPVMLMAAYLLEDGKYHILTSEPIEMETNPDHRVETLQNAEKVLNIAEGFIRQAPEQWTVSLPVWPEALDQVPPE